MKEWRPIQSGRRKDTSTGTIAGEKGCWFGERQPNWDKTKGKEAGVFKPGQSKPAISHEEAHAFGNGIDLHCIRNFRKLLKKGEGEQDKSAFQGKKRERGGRLTVSFGNGRLDIHGESPSPRTYIEGEDL